MSWPDALEWISAVGTVLGPLGGAAGIAAWQQTKHARRSAAAAERSAAAAENQAEQATRQVVLLEQQNTITQNRWETEQQRRQAKETRSHVTHVADALSAAEQVRVELRDDCARVAEHNDRPRPGPYNSFGPPKPLRLSIAETQWTAARKVLRLNKPPDPDLHQALDDFDELVTTLSTIIDETLERADNWQLIETDRQQLSDTCATLDQRYQKLRHAGEAFLHAHGHDPRRGPVP